MAKGPTTVGIEATMEFAYLTSEILPLTTPYSGMNHAILCVGYTKYYWIV